MTQPSKKALLWIVLGASLLAVSEGRWVAPALLFLAPVFLVRGMRRAPVRWALPLFVLFHTLAWEVAYLGTVPLPTVARLGLFSGLSLCLGLVFWADRWAAQRMGRVSATLVLPTGWVAFEFLQALASPSGTWGSIAYGLADQVALLQLVSVTGWTGLTFLVAWTGPVFNGLWERGLSWAPARRGAVLWVAACAGIWTFGSARLALAPHRPTVRVAAVVAPGTFDEDLEEVWRYTRGVELDEEIRRIARDRIATSMEEHFSLVERELAAGARLAVWAEANASMTEREEIAWVERAQEAARRHSAFVGMGLTVFRPDSREPTKNEFILVGPGGEVLWTFYKATRVFGDDYLVGDGVLPTADTNLGRLSAAICFDLDFPRLIRQVGLSDTDILLAPSNDWEEVRGIHARMAVVRAAEQGVALLRPTKDGISIAADGYGRVLGTLDAFASETKVLVADIPTNGSTVTLYSRLGDLFSWICAAVFVVLLSVSARRKDPG